MAYKPQYVASPRIGAGQVTTANTALNGTGTVVTVFTAGASGSRIDTISIKAAAATTAGMIRLFIYDGSAYRLLSEVPVNAATPSATQASWEWHLTMGNLSPILPIILPTGYSLRATTEKSEAINIIAQGGDF